MDDHTPSTVLFDQQIGPPHHSSKLTLQVQNDILDKIRNGCHPNVAAGLCGINPQVFRSWMEKGSSQDSGPYRVFYEAVLQAQAEDEFWAVGMFRRKILEADYKGAKDYLARRYPDRWGEKVKTEVSGKIEQEPLDPKKLSEEELDQMRLMVQKIGKEIE